MCFQSPTKRRVSGKDAAITPAVSPVSTLKPALYKPPKPKRVVLHLESSARASTAYGSDVYGQILFMRLDGLSVGQIADAIGCGDDLVCSVVNLWQEQVRIREGENFTPRRRNPRRAANRPKNDKNTAS